MEYTGVSNSITLLAAAHEKLLAIQKSVKELRRRPARLDDDLDFVLRSIEKAWKREREKAALDKKWLTHGLGLTRYETQLVEFLQKQPDWQAHEVHIIEALWPVLDDHVIMGGSFRGSWNDADEDDDDHKMQWRLRTHERGVRRKCAKHHAAFTIDRPYRDGTVALVEVA